MKIACTVKEGKPMKHIYSLLVVLMLSSCAHRFFVPHYMEEHHVNDVVQVMVDQYFSLKPFVGNSVSINPNSGYSEMLASKFRAKGYSVFESQEGYRLEFLPHETQEGSDVHMLIASLNQNGQARFNMLFEIHRDSVVPSTTSVLQL